MIDRRLVLGLMSAAAMAPESVFSQQGNAVLKHAQTSTLDIAYEDSGPEAGFPALLMHGDATIDFDLRTAAATPSAPKRQPRWLAAAYGSFVNKEGANYQIQIGALFRYDRCPELRRPGSIDLIAAAWLACKPLVDLKR